MIFSIWFLLGLCGHFLMRQGFLVAFEGCSGKKGAWDFWTKINSLIFIVGGPVQIIFALLICGSDCFRKRPALKL